MIGDKNQYSVVAERRIGHFRINSDLLRVASDEEICSLFDGFLIVKAEVLFHGDEIEYTAYHRQFGQVEYGGLIPDYILKFTLDAGVMKRIEIAGK